MAATAIPITQLQKRRLRQAQQDAGSLTGSSSPYTQQGYALFNFSSEPEFPAELSRVLNITDGVLRSLIIKK